MDIISLSFTQSGNEVTIKTDLGYFELSKADAKSFFSDFFDAEPLEILENLPLFASKEAAEMLSFLSEKLSCIKYGVYILGIGDKSEKQMSRKMREKGYNNSVIFAAIEVLKKNNYISDERFCKRKCEILANSKLFGRRRIISELISRGVSPELCDMVLDESEIDFDQNLSLLFEKLMNKKKIDFSDRQQVKKISDKLLRYGYSYYEVSGLISSYTDE